MTHLATFSGPNSCLARAPGGRRILAGCLALLAGSWLWAADEAPHGPSLKVEVVTPPSWNLLMDDRVSEWFVDGVRAELARQGFEGQVDEIRYPDDPGKAPFLLTINLAEWRMSRAGFVDCTLTATLHTPDGERRLGVYHHSLPRWMGGFGRWGLQRTFEETADEVVARLCRDLVRSEMLPGLRRLSA